MSAYLLIDLSTSRRLISVVLSSLGRKGLVLVLGLLLILLSLSSGSELEIRITKKKFKVSVIFNSIFFRLYTLRSDSRPEGREIGFVGLPCWQWIAHQSSRGLGESCPFPPRNEVHLGAPCIPLRRLRHRRELRIERW